MFTPPCIVAVVFTFQCGIWIRNRTLIACPGGALFPLYHPIDGTALIGSELWQKLCERHVCAWFISVKSCTSSLEISLLPKTEETGLNLGTYNINASCLFISRCWRKKLCLLGVSGYGFTWMV